MLDTRKSTLILVVGVLVLPLCHVRCRIEGPTYETINRPAAASESDGGGRWTAKTKTESNYGDSVEIKSLKTTKIKEKVSETSEVRKKNQAQTTEKIMAKPSIAPLIETQNSTQRESVLVKKSKTVQTDMKAQSEPQRAGNDPENIRRQQRLKIVQGRQLTRTLDGWENRAVDFNQLVQQVNQTDEGKWQLRALRNNLAGLIRLWEQKRRIIFKISQKEQLSSRHRQQLQRIFNQQTLSTENQRNVLSILDEPPQMETADGDNLGQLTNILTRAAETKDGRRQLTQLRLVMKDGLENQWEFDRALTIVYGLSSRDKLGALQRKQLERMLGQLTRSRMKLQSLEETLSDLTEGMDSVDEDADDG